MATTVLAFAMWFHGPTSRFTSRPNVAHAAGAPIAIRFNGAQASAHGSDWDSMGANTMLGGDGSVTSIARTSGDVLLPVILPSKQELADKAARRATLAAAATSQNVNGKIILAAAGLLVLIPSAKIYAGRKNKDRTGDRDDFKPILTESAEPTKKKMTTVLPIPTTITKVEVKRESVTKPIPTVATMVKVKKEPETKKSEEAASTSPLFTSAETERKQYLVTEIAFLALSVLSTAGSIFYL